MENYDFGIDFLNKLTVYDCISLYLREGLRVVINDGIVINLVKEDEE